MGPTLSDVNTDKNNYVQSELSYLDCFYDSVECLALLNSSQVLRRRVEECPPILPVDTATARAVIVSALIILAFGSL